MHQAIDGCHRCHRIFENLIPLGIPNVLDRMIQQAFIQTGKTWVVDIDLRSFFDQVNHDKLMGKVRDKRLLRLIGDYCPPCPAPPARWKPAEAPPRHAARRPAVAAVGEHLSRPAGQGIGESRPRLRAVCRRHRHLCQQLAERRAHLRERGGVDRKAPQGGSEPREKRQRPVRSEQPVGLSLVKRRTHRGRAQSHRKDQGQSPRVMGCPPKSDQRAIARSVAKIHSRLVVLLPTRRLAKRSVKPKRMDSASHAQMLLVTVENATGSIQRVVCQRSMADGAALGTAAIAEE
jgi:hypothetical protein